MKRYLIIIALILTSTAGMSRAQLTVGSGQKVATINDKINKNQFVWLSKAPLENIQGTSEAVKGKIVLDPADLSKMTGWMTTDVASMQSGNGPRDEHLAGPQWLDAKKYPKIKFEIAAITNLKVDGNAATGYANGTFIMHGVSKSMIVPFSLRYLPENPKTRERAPGDLVMFSADFNISLKDFNVAGTDGMVGSKVGETINIKAQLFANTAPAANE